MIQSNNTNKYFSLENCYIKINQIKSNNEYQCLEVSKYVFSFEDEPLAGIMTYTPENLIFSPGFLRKKRKCYISEIFYIRKVEIRRLFYYNKKGKHGACN